MESPEFDAVLVSSIRGEVEPERPEEMIDRCRTFVAAWAGNQRAR